MIKIVLLGYMGSGKSAVGKEVAKELGIEFLDLDQHIQEKEGASISEIFTEKGEIYFRKLEHQELRVVLDGSSEMVVALGGGTPCYAGNMEYLLESIWDVYYLKATIPELAERLWFEKELRPLIAYVKDKTDLSEFIGKHLFERAPYYEQAQYHIPIGNRSVGDLVNEIVNNYRR